MTAAVPTSPTGTAIATATKLTPWVCAEGLAPQMWTAMCDASTVASGNSTCGVCNGPGDIYECGCDDISGGDCDCNGNQLDALGVCGGTCSADVDGDGVCDDVDSCVGAFDICGVCNGPGDVYECGCMTSPTGSAIATATNLTPGVCEGTCSADVDGDGVCDDVDSCVGELSRRVQWAWRRLRMRLCRHPRRTAIAPATN